MAFYLISIIGMDALICVLNLLFNKFNLSSIHIILASVLGALGVIFIDAIVALFVRRVLPEKYFTYKNQKFCASKKECKFYEKIGIKNWKDKVVELGMFTNFSKKSVANPESKEYVERFILECNYGSEIHILSVFIGYVLIFFYPLKYALCFALPIATVNAFLNLLPFMILRYNVERLSRLRNILEKKENRSNLSS